MEHKIFRIIKVIIKIVPIIISLKYDRRDWIKKKGKNVNVVKYRKHANKILRTFVSLGPVYIKFGQWLSSRADILPQPYLYELSNLQDNVPQAPFDIIKTLIDTELGQAAFDSISPTAISGASLAQAHLAQLQGKTVIVKVKRPGIAKIVELDIKILIKTLPFITKFVDPSIKTSMQAMTSQFIETIYEEMNYDLELKNLRIIKKNLSNFNNVIIPDIYENYSTSNILTMEYIPGIKITNIEKLDRQGIDRVKLVHDLHEIFFTMLLRHKIFHADPHPGNISVSKNGSIIIYDYGMVGRLDKETRMLLIRLYLALVDKDTTRTINIMYKLGMLIPNFDHILIEKSIDMSINSLHGKKPTENEIHSLTSIVNKSIGKFPFILPKNLSLYIRMTSIIEGIYKTHNVNFKLIKILQKILTQEHINTKAYFEESYSTVLRILKSVDSTISIMPELHKFLIKRNLDNQSQKPNKSMAVGIFTSSIFIGSIFLYPMNEILGSIGFITSLIVGIIFLKK